MCYGCKLEVVARYRVRKPAVLGHVDVGLVILTRRMRQRAATAWDLVAGRWMDISTNGVERTRHLPRAFEMHDREMLPPPTFSKLSMAVVEARGKKKGVGLTPLDRDVRYPYAKLI